MRGATLLRSMFYIVLLALAVLAAFFLIPTTVRYHVVERYTFAGGESQIPLALGVIVPRSGPYQTVSPAAVEWEGILMRHTESTIELLLLEGTLGSDGRQTAQISYDVILRQGPIQWEAPILPRHLQLQPNIESDAPALLARAADLAGSEETDDALSIFNFTAGHLKWAQGTRLEVAPSALDAYRSGTGNYAEFSNLMVALCRAAEIPALTVRGLAFSPLTPPLTTVTATWRSPAGPHAWVEVHTDAGWTLADPSWASRLPFRWMWFGRTSGTHLSYGETISYNEHYARLSDWVAQRGNLAAAMSAPLAFAAAADVSREGDIVADDARLAEQITLTPTVTVRKGWDGRWGVALSIYLVLTGLILVVERSIARHRVHPQAVSGGRSG